MERPRLQAPGEEYVCVRKYITKRVGGKKRKKCVCVCVCVTRLISQRLILVAQEAKAPGSR